MARRKRFRGSTLLIVLLLVAAAVVAFIPLEGSGPDAGAVSQPTTEHVVAAPEKVDIPGDIPNVVLNYEGFTVGFNPKMHQPNYVVWTLEPEETDGDNSRSTAQFQADETVDGCATLYDYKNSGFDRGHMAPAADMKWSEQAMADCHLLTNMCPQDKRLNSGAWATVEKNSRKWAQKHGALTIVAGPILSDRLKRKIGTTPVPVPERFFKVIVAPHADPPLGIGFIMPNGYVEGGAEATVVSIDQVEEITGFDFFSELPDSIENIIESQAKLRLWNK